MMNVLREGFTCRRCGRSDRANKHYQDVCSDCTEADARMTRPHPPQEQTRENARLLMTWGV